MAQINISLPHGLKSWVDSRVAKGRYSSPSDYIRELVRRDERDKAIFARLQEDIDRGRSSGEGRPASDVMNDLHARLKDADG